MVSIALSLLTRGSILTCNICGEQVTVQRRNELPTGWIILVSPKQEFIDIYCSKHDPKVQA